MVRTRFTVSQKLAVIADANQRMGNGESLKSVCRSYNIQPNQLRDWKRKVDDLARGRKHLKALHGGLKGRLHAFEEPIVGWILEMREHGVPLCYKHVVLKAIQVDPTFAELSTTAQYQAVRRLCIRNCVGLRRVTHTSQVHPQETMDLALQWIQHIRPTVSAPGVGKRWVINMDQTPIWLSMHPQTTLNLVGAATVNGRRTGESGARFTCTIAISANGDKLRPFLIFKGQPQGHIATREFPGNPDRVAVDLCCQKSAWQDEENMLKWINTALVPYLQEKAAGAPALLLLDHFSAHWTQNVRDRMEELGVTLHKIPPGCTGYVQPIDVGIGKPFKDRVRSKWWDWMLSLDPTAAAFATASREQAIAWVRQSWDEIPVEIARNAWLKTGYSYFVDE